MAYPLPAGASLVQTFRLTTPSLAALDLLLERPPAAPATGTLWLSLRSGDGRLLATGALPADAIQGPGWFRLAVPPMGRPAEELYTLEVATDGAASVWVRGSAAAVYPDGRLAMGGQALPGALAFRAHYRYDLPLLLRISGRDGGRVSGSPSSFCSWSDQGFSGNGRWPGPSRARCAWPGGPG